MSESTITAEAVSRSDTDGVQVATVAEWQCHLHPNHSCLMRYQIDGQFAHLIPIDKIAHNQRGRIVDGKYFVDRLGSFFYVSSIYYTKSFRSNPGFALKAMFKHMDENRIKYKPDDAKTFLEVHAVVALNNTLALTMQHKLIKSCKPQVYYTSAKWMMSVLKVLFPRIADPKVDSSTPQWAMQEWIRCQNETRLKRKRS